MKVFILLVLGVLMMGVVSAVSNVNIQANINLQNSENHSNVIGQNLSLQIAEKRTEYKSGNFTTSLGQYLNVREMASGLRELRDGNVSANTSLKLIKAENNESKLEAELSNGSTAEIKIMPSAASQIALERLRLKICNEKNNCTIELKEVGNGTVEYNIQIERHSKILGIFEKKMQVSAEVDAQTGNIISEHKPWWALIATEPAE